MPEDLPQQPIPPASSASMGMRVFQTMLSTEQAMLQMLRQIARDNAARQDMLNRFTPNSGSNVNGNEGQHADQGDTIVAPSSQQTQQAQQAHASSGSGDTYRPVSAESLMAQNASAPVSAAGAGAGAGSGAGGPGGGGGGSDTPENADTPEGAPGGDGGGGAPGRPGESSAPPSGGSGVGPGSAGNSIPYVGAIQRAIGHVPVVGGLVNTALNSTVVGAYSKVTGEMQSQQDKNDYYRNIEGGGNVDAGKERAGEEWFAAKDQASMTMNSADARTVYKGVTRLGYDGQSQAGGYNRSDLLNFANNAKKERGEDPSEILSQASSFSKNATANLKEFNNALNSVSQVASKAGVNTNMARAQMQSLFDQFTQQGMGKGATTTAAAITNMDNSLGKAYSAGTNSSGMTSNNYESMVAASSGMNQAQLATGLRHGSASAYKAYDQFWNQNMVALTDGQKSWIKQYKSGHPKESDDKIADAFRDYFETGEGASGPDAIGNENVWTANMQQQSGKDWGGDPHKAALFAVQLSTGQNPLQKAAATKGGKTSSNMATTIAKTVTNGGGSGSSYNSSPAKMLGGVKSAAEGISHLGDKIDSAANSAGKDIEHGVSNAWNWLTGGDDGKKKSSAAKEPEHSSKPQHGQYGAKSSSHHPASSDAHRIVIDTTPAAQKLIKAMVVTGGDPYKAAGAASGAAPQTPQQTSTR